MGYKDTTDFELKRFAERLKHFRRRHHLTQERLAAAMGTGLRVIVMLENCQERPYTATIAKFANLEEKYERAMDVEMESLEGMS